MLHNYKLFFKYVLFNFYHLYIKHNIHGSKNISIVLPQSVLYYTTFHFKFSSIFYSTQLVDIFAYELPISSNNTSNNNSIFSKTLTSDSIVVYNFHNLTFQERFFIFAVNIKSQISNFALNSVTELFPNAWWLEREVAELHGVNFQGKKDLRNLLLQYGDTSVPFQKSFPSIGVKEMFYDSISDLIIQAPLTIQV